MASVTKNPFILQSANYIYNWFLSINEKNNTLIQNASSLETVLSDKAVLERIQSNTLQERKDLDVEERLKFQKKVMFHE
ncbi:hypothetical protein [Fusobacterium necrophorum]|uniref:Uncharacterized protein n=1 Tax=Fusobacterium necrophorum subsp. funduliforme TaxID=143387 RepID=A0A161QWJ1_9FUSO|nr:hypothetical protein [Fusobacterium necrophorum]AVQ21485.1 hypothetical protein C4N15_07410 [Fusobacterium necrophorum subsp. funduliforme]KYL05322.1 hypothetical protein A2J07_00875 [Fusobacterium necrophorum subsp. funduliforme]MDK4523150.1 hypothetical protein [Fusobacterium necrophorum]